MILSSYSDVLAALKNPQFWPASPLPEKLPKVPNPAAQQQTRREVLAAFPATKLAHWRAQLEELAARLPNNRPIDLAGEFTEPFCLDAAELVCESSPADRETLLSLAKTISASAAEPLNRDLQKQASQANKDLAKALDYASIPMVGPTFVALSQTLACILANGWLELLTQPDRLGELRAQPDLIPAAVEEILRLAGVPRTIVRFAIAGGERVILNIAAANRDPEHFSNPDRLDWHRRDASHLSLGHGAHSCVGGALLRMAIAVALRAFVERFDGAKISGEIRWTGGSGFRSPAALYVA